MERFPTTAQSLAADLAGAHVDPNEAQKALAYLRSKRDPKLFFEYLRAIVKDGRAVIRSGQTLGYYRDLLAASERHLRGLSYDEMAQTLGWGIRLLRYYRVVPEAVQAQVDMPHEQPAPRREAQVVPPKPVVPQLPTIGDSFVGKVLEVSDTDVVIEIPNFPVEQALGVIKADVLGGKHYVEGNPARVEVIGSRTLKNGRTIFELKPGAKRENKTSS